MYIELGQYTANYTTYNILVYNNIRQYKKVVYIGPWQDLNLCYKLKLLISGGRRGARGGCAQAEVVHQKVQEGEG
jgi:hypothetical protein